MNTKYGPDSVAVHITHKKGNNRLPMRREEERERTRIVSVVVALFLAVIVLIILTIPAYRTLRSAQADVSASVVRLESAREVSDAYDALHADVGRYADAVLRAERALPSMGDSGLSDTPERIAVIEAIAVREAGGVLIENIEVASSDELKALPDISGVSSRRIKIGGLAGLDGFKRFISATRKSLNLMDPIYAELSYANEGVITFTLVLDGYVLAQ